MHLRLTRRLRGCGFSCLRRDMVKVVAGEELLTRAQVLLIAQSGRFDNVNTNDTVLKMQKRFGHSSQCTVLQKKMYG